MAVYNDGYNSKEEYEADMAWEYRKGGPNDDSFEDPDEGTGQDTPLDFMSPDEAIAVLSEDKDFDVCDYMRAINTAILALKLVNDYMPLLDKAVDGDLRAILKKETQ